MAGYVTRVDDRRGAGARRALRWTGGLLAGAGVLAAAQPAAAAPFVVVDAALERTGGDAVVTGRVTWDRDAARAEPDRMTVGDLRLVAVSDGAHRPTLLATARTDAIADDPVQAVRLPIAGEDLAAVRPGNRVVLTASQHGRAGDGTRTARTYVTVAQLQPFDTPQDRIGRRACGDVAIVPGAQLSGCDLVGADLDRAIVSVRRPAGTRMLLADLTGATLVAADLTGLSVAGGRLNGADATRAILDNLSLAGAEATGLVARDATSDRDGGTAGADLFDARLDDADFRGALLNGVSLSASRFDGADFRGATWNGVMAEAAGFRGADLRGLRGVGSTVAFADFTDARLRGAPLTAADLMWATLCRTEMPDGEPPGGQDRDCRDRVDPGPPPAPGRVVAVEDGALERRAGRAVVRGIVGWSAAAIRSGLSAGDVRAVAIDGDTGVPTTVGALSIPDGLPASTPFAATVTDPEALAALRRGNRVVLTATQHRPELTGGSYVTVATVQAGPGRGRVGSRDCSDVLIGTLAPPAGGYDLCDLPGAVLRKAELAGSMRLADLTGADLRGAGLRGVALDGAALGGVTAAGADAAGLSMVQAWAPRLEMPRALIRSGQLRAARLDRADFAGSTMSDTTFATAPLRGAAFSGAAFDKVDLAYADLDGARLDDVDAVSEDPRRARRTSLFLADLTDATLAGSAFDHDEAGDRPWRWATLCRTVLPADAGVDGDRDCPALRP